MANREYKAKKSKWKAYCAIDVGCLSSGYAYSFKDTDHVWVNDNWAEHLNYFSPRVPSAVLYDAKGLPQDFGFSACESYINMPESERTSFYFPGLLNHSDNIKEDSLETFASGQQFKELSDLTMSHHVTLALLLGRHCKREIEKKYKRTPDKCVWVFIVPTSWKLDQKSRYRSKLLNLYKDEFHEEFKSGRHKMRIVNTTEALWLSVRDDAKKQLDGGPFKKSKKNEKSVIILHSEGTRTEMSLHTGRCGRLPLKAPLSIHNGEIYLNQVFEKFLKNSLSPNGQKIIDKFKSDHPTAWLEFMLTFESAKSACWQKEFNDVLIDIHYSFVAAFSAITGKDIVDLLTVYSPGKNNKPLTVTEGGKLVLSGSTVKKVCTDIMSSVVRYMKKMGGDTRLSGILLAGAFGESPFVRQYLSTAQEEKAMDPVRLHTPDNSSLLLPIGAVLCAKEPVRTLNHSYAIQIWRKRGKVDTFIVKMQYKKGEDVEILHTLLSKNQEIAVGQSYLFDPIPLSDTYKDHFRAILYAFPETLQSPLDFSTQYYAIGERMDNAVMLHDFIMKIPQCTTRESCKIQCRVTMDQTSFETVLVLETDMDKQEMSIIKEYLH